MKLFHQALFLLLPLSLLGLAHGHVGGDAVHCGESGPSQPISAEFVGSGSTASEAIAAAAQLAILELSLDWSCAEDCSFWDTEFGIMDMEGRVDTEEVLVEFACDGEINWLNTTWTPTISNVGNVWSCSMQITGDYNYDCLQCP